MPLRVGAGRAANRPRRKPEHLAAHARTQEDRASWTMPGPRMKYGIPGTVVGLGDLFSWHGPPAHARLRNMRPLQALTTALVIFASIVALRLLIGPEKSPA